MKSVIIISLVTFVLIFGGVLVVSNHLNRAAQTGGLPILTPDDYHAAERVYLDLATERDRIQQEKEELFAMQQEFAIQTQTLAEARTNLQAVIAKLESRQQAFIAEKERSAAKLAKMYEAMKPAQAAPILAALDMRDAMREQRLEISIGVNTALMTVGEIETQLNLAFTEMRQAIYDRQQIEITRASEAMAGKNKNPVGRPSI